MKRIAILGPGLLGGSLALRLHALGGWHVSLWARRAEAVKEIQARNCADAASTDLGEMVRDADIVIFCTPLAAMSSLAHEVAAAVKPGTLVTDVGSVKAPVLKELIPIFSDRVRFIGSHPMAGNQFTGLKAADAQLYVGTTCIITPCAMSAQNAEFEVSEFWEKVGCRVVSMSAEEHDTCVALISHLPHLTAGALIQTAGAKNPRAFGVVGPGFRDTTRVASGPPEMWVGILRENRVAATASLDDLISKLRELREILAAPTLDEYALFNHLAKAKTMRDQIHFPQ